VIRRARPARPPALRSFGVAFERCGDLGEGRRGLLHGDALATGMSLMRDLANLPANVCTPSHLAATARQLARQHRSIGVQVLGEPEMRRLKMGSLLSVTAGTGEPARLIVVRYRGGARDAAPVVLVSKGVTFDSGGISLKPPPYGRDEVRHVGRSERARLIKAAAMMGLPLNIVSVIPTARTCRRPPPARRHRPQHVGQTSRSSAPTPKAG
jgi:leucyl aminopeptidase